MVVARVFAALFSTLGSTCAGAAAVIEGAAPEAVELPAAVHQAEVGRHHVTDDVQDGNERQRLGAAAPGALAAVMRREQRTSAGAPPKEWQTPMDEFHSGYDVRNLSAPEGFDMGHDGQGDFPPGEYKVPEPVAQRCYDGGHSGGHFFDYQLFAHGIQPIPPMTIVARIRTSVHGREQTFMGWKPIHDGDKAKSEILLTSDGNLEYRLHDGYKQWNVSAAPKVNLADGRWHTVAVVREGDNQSIGITSLYADNYQIGEGYVDGWASHLQPWATSLQVDLDAGQSQFRGFEGDVEDVRIFDEALSAKYIKRIGVESCTIAVRPAEYVHSNLGGHGPDSGEQALRFFRAATFRKRVLDLVIQNTTEYLPKFPERNGIATDAVGRINLMANKPTRFSFRFVETNTDEDVRVDSFGLSFFHVDQGERSGSQEIFTVEHMVDQYFVTNKSTEVFVTGSDLDSSLTFRSVIHSPNRPRPAEIVASALNPEDTDDLTLAQSEASFGIRIVRASGFGITMELVGEDGHARDILFGGNSSIFKQGVPTVPI
eukprot:SRR837773.2920.p1 GENE.SRR837773.2920~~SRR837773.2920.p1  ORF type:complete len:542 (+),score=125.47 SRR837773.2920:3-1628(+)